MPGPVLIVRDGSPHGRLITREASPALRAYSGGVRRAGDANAVDSAFHQVAVSTKKYAGIYKLGAAFFPRFLCRSAHKMTKPALEVARLDFLGQNGYTKSAPRFVVPRFFSTTSTTRIS